MERSCDERRMTSNGLERWFLFFLPNSQMNFPGNTTSPSKSLLDMHHGNKCMVTNACSRHIVCVPQTTRHENRRIHYSFCTSVRCCPLWHAMCQPSKTMCAIWKACNTSAICVKATTWLHSNCRSGMPSVTRARLSLLVHCHCTCSVFTTRNLTSATHWCITWFSPCLLQLHSDVLTCATIHHARLSSRWARKSS